MKHQMRRADLELSENEARAILSRADHGILATVGKDGWPYAVPVNHVLVGDLLYFHCALSGHKLENICHEDRISYSVVTLSEVLPEKLTTRYDSAIVFGRARVLEDPAEKRCALHQLGERFSQLYPNEITEAIRAHGPRTAIVCIQIERLTGKSNRSS